MEEHGFTIPRLFLDLQCLDPQEQYILLWKSLFLRMRVEFKYLVNC